METKELVEKLQEAYKKDGAKGLRKFGYSLADLRALEAVVGVK